MTRPRPFLRRGLWLLLLLATLLVAIAIDALRVLRQPMLLDAEMTLSIEEGEPLATTVERLTTQGALPPWRGALYLRIYARLMGLETRLKAGEYRIVPGLSPVQALDLFVSGKTVLHELRIIEGWTFRQALAALRAHPQIRQTLGQADADAVMAAIGRAGVHPEGRLFPDTYRFARGTADVTLLRRAAEAMERVLAQEWDMRAENLPYQHPDEALIMASIVEKETGVPEERAQIAGVFVRRLQLGMRLQTDPTVIYGLGEKFDGNLRLRDLRTDGDYNTYTRSGLPPTPICLPGRAAIRAALHPQPGKALFFVSRGDGTHVFSETLAEHEAAVRRYQLKQ